MYATDDLLILSPNVIDLQNLLDICIDYMVTNTIFYLTPRKFAVFQLERPIQTIHVHQICIKFVIKWIANFNYFCIASVTTKTLDIDINCIKRKFHAALNDIGYKCI